MSKANRMMEERLARLERFERARYYRWRRRIDRFWLSLVIVAALITAVGFGRLM